MIKSCQCTHPAQDVLHGKNNRVYNPTKKTKGDKAVQRCSVCGNES